MVVKYSFTSGMEVTREKIVRLGGCWELAGVPGVVGVGGVEVSVADIARGGTGGGGKEERRRDGVLVRGVGFAAVLSG